jgi:dienelactone hydrolase
MIKTQLIEYKDGDAVLEGYAAIPDGKNIPVVLVAHDWSGNNEFARHKADELAGLGYIGFALDMYGKGRIGKTKDEKIALMGPFMHDRNTLQRRMNVALATAKNIPEADASRVAAIGFCFGGLCVLDLARSGADLRGVVSFHGLFIAPGTEQKPLIAKVLALHGYDDPMAKSDQVVAFANEMTELKADWQLHVYGNTMHAFMNPEANDAAFGTVYQPTTAARAWRQMQDFFSEVLG